MKKHGRYWTSPFEGRLGSYSLAAGVALASAGTAQADIIYTLVDQQADFGHIDLNHDGHDDFRIYGGGGSQQGFSVNEVIAQAAIGNGEAILPGPDAAALNKGDQIGGNLQFGSFGYLAWSRGSPLGGSVGGYFLNTQGKYLALRFSLNGNTFYGWARVDIDGFFRTTLVDYAYDNVANETIGAGDAGNGVNSGVPEPNTLGLLAVGAAGLALWRKKRTAASHTAG